MTVFFDLSFSVSNILLKECLSVVKLFVTINDPKLHILLFPSFKWNAMLENVIMMKSLKMPKTWMKYADLNKNLL
jgi:hypothetical protein